MDLAQILDLIKQHGDIVYGFLFAHALYNSLLAPLFTGYAAHMDALELRTVIPVCWAGGFIGDTVRFWIARQWGHKLTEAFPRIGKGIIAMRPLIDRHHAWMILIHRYPHGIRGLAAFAYGASGLDWRRFLVLNFVSAGLWAAAVVMIGYSFGHMSEKALGEAASTAGFAVLALFLGLAWLLSKRLERAMAQQ